MNCINTALGWHCINCTVVELKHHIVNLIGKYCFVLIVPLWNWNAKVFLSQIPNDCINCTVVELKLYAQSLLYESSKVLIVPLWNWNFPDNLLFHPFVNVLIVPLWNWNEVARKDQNGTKQCINCTVVELKLSWLISLFLLMLVLIVPLWNWNALDGIGFQDLDAVLIVPLWNWNVFPLCLLSFPFLY